MLLSFTEFRIRNRQLKLWFAIFEPSISAEAVLRALNLYLHHPIPARLRLSHLCNMDPITIATTLITFSSFIKDLIEIGQSIQSSIEKVWNMLFQSKTFIEMNSGWRESTKDPRAHK